MAKGLNCYGVGLEFQASLVPIPCVLAFLAYGLASILSADTCRPSHLFLKVEPSLLLRGS